MNKSNIISALLCVAIGTLGTATVQKIVSDANKSKLNGNYRKIALILKSIEDNYVDSVDHKKVTEEIAAAALSALDPHSIYLPPVELKDTEEELAGNFDGIGIQFNVPNDTAVVIEVIPGGPSDKTGLQPGDRILKVDSTNIAGVGFPQDSMVSRMKGKAGSKVNILVGRNGEKIPFEITRGKIPTHSVSAAFMVDDTTAYLRLSKFSRTTEEEFMNTASSLKDQGMTSMILDLRDNSGGFLDQALALSNAFLEKNSQIVYMEGLHRKREDFRANGRGMLLDTKLSILIDEGTASSSEVLSGALQDNGRATIVGRRSYGKGLVQEPFYFNDGSGMRITVARFYTPSGRCIQKPYTKDYQYEVYHRYDNGEMYNADSMKVEDGGIIPDVFVPVDTTKAGSFYIACSKKATAMRYASAYFDSHKKELGAIDDYNKLLTYLDNSSLEKGFLDFAKSRDGLSPKGDEWQKDKPYLMTQVRALVGRYSKLGDNAYYHIFLYNDDTFNAAIEQQRNK